MPYLAFDLDAKRRCELVARAADSRPGDIAWGLLELWEHAYRAQSAVVSSVVLKGCFGSDERIPEALETFEFTEKVEAGYRVRGAERYLQISESRTKAGKARAASAKRDASGRLSTDVLEQQHSNTSTSPAHAGDLTSSEPALTAVSRQQSAKEPSPSEKGAARATPPPPEPFELQPTNGDPRPRKRSEAQEFFDCARSELQRVKGKLPEAELDPPVLNRWFAPAVAEVGLERLWAAFCAWVLKPRDDFWAKRNWPFRGFMKVWRDYVPREVPREIADAVE